MAAAPHDDGVVLLDWQSSCTDEPSPSLICNAKFKESIEVEH